MSDESRVLLDMATLADVEGEKVRARKLREVSVYIEDLELAKMQGEKRITALEEGECRFHCRVRADMWRTGVVYGREHLQLTPEEAYEQWRTQYQYDE